MKKKVTLRHEREPQNFAYYLRTDFEKGGRFVSLWKLNEGPNYIGNAPQKAWVDYGMRCPVTDELMVETLRTYRDETEAWDAYTELIRDIEDGAVAIVREEAYFDNRDDGMYGVTLECY